LWNIKLRLLPRGSKRKFPCVIWPEDVEDRNKLCLLSSTQILPHGATVLEGLRQPHSFLSIFLFSCSYRPHFIPIFLSSSLTFSIHLFYGFSLFLSPPRIPYKAFLKSLFSSILQTCPSHLNREVLITITNVYLGKVL
jgi:hypothetical protein